MSSPAVSVALPVYNVAPHLRACLDSIIGQEFQDMEIICVNDGSTDESPEILAEYAAKDPRIRIVNQPNKGLSSTRNTALQHVRGRYLLHVDSDDILRRDAVALLYEECERTQADFIVFYHSMIEGDREFDSWYYDFDQWSLEPKATLEQKLEILHYHYTWSKFFRMDFLKQHDFRFPDGLQFDDNIYHWQVLLAAKKVVILPQKLYRYRMRSGSIMWHRGRHHLDIFYIFGEGKRVFKERGVYDAVFRDFMQYKMSLQYFWMRDIEPRFRWQGYSGILEGMTEDEERFVRDHGEELLDPEALHFYRRLFASRLYRHAGRVPTVAMLVARRYLSSARARTRSALQRARARVSGWRWMQPIKHRVLGRRLIMDPQCAELAARANDYQSVATYWIDFWRSYLREREDEMPKLLEDVKRGLSENDQALVDVFYRIYEKYLPECADYSKFMLHKDLLWRPKERFLQSTRPAVQVDSRYQPFLDEYPWLSADVFAALYGTHCFPRDLRGRLRAHGDVIDAGAFIGDSAVQFADFCPNARVLALEPDPVNFKRLQENVKQFGLDGRIIPEPVGLHDHQGSFQMHHHGVTDFPDQGTSLLNDFRQEDGDQGADLITCELTTIDALVEKHGLRPVLIKLDIEGVEKEALLGARETLMRYRPALIVSVYHHPKDFFEIKPWLESLDLGYCFAFRRIDMQAPVSDMVMLCYPPLASLGGRASD
ncbi:FkbM family methyltransferase [Thiorhodococcus minor]|uniref:FkbM family methyltransferase n=1 Tax=Thiorhodococcus minor TaxID=57489 RepID=A0A6M0JU52_9GAMM|nr:FkbM family methyltransferase [Thiorhodococcus minor]NEV61042.1 FkbM family methyltransferase [Thiorhodococcus minor]